MSNLISIFDTWRGWPDASALAVNFKAAAGVSLPAGTVVTQQGLQIASAKVLKAMDDNRVTAPTLTAGNAGQAYVVAGVGGAWSTFAIGDIVEWSGTAWVKIVTQVEAEVPTGTRVVITGGTAAGSFTGHEEKVLQYAKTTAAITCKAAGYTPCGLTDVTKLVTGGTSGHTAHLVSYDNGTRIWVVDPVVPAETFHTGETLTIGSGGTGVGDVESQVAGGGAWAATVPVDNQQLTINGVGSLYVGKQVQYQGTHPAGAWIVLGTTAEATTFVNKLTSAAHSNVAPDSAWMVIEGNDQFDGIFTSSVTCVKLSTGVVIKLASTIANTLAPGAFLYANAGVLALNTGTYNTVAQVLESNNTAGATGFIVIVA